MRCNRCGKPLTDAESIRKGYGPECWGMLQAENEAIRDEMEQLDMVPFSGDVILERNKKGIKTNIPHRYIKHSETMEWGYGGSGPSDMALNILCMYIPYEKAIEGSLYQAFKWDFISKMPEDGGIIKKGDIINWLEQHEIKIYL